MDFQSGQHHLCLSIGTAALCLAHWNFFLNEYHGWFSQCLLICSGTLNSSRQKKHWLAQLENGSVICLWENFTGSTGFKYCQWTSACKTGLLKKKKEVMVMFQVALLPTIWGEEEYYQDRKKLHNYSFHIFQSMVILHEISLPPPQASDQGSWERAVCQQVFTPHNKWHRLSVSQQTFLIPNRDLPLGQAAQDARGLQMALLCLFSTHHIRQWHYEFQTAKCSHISQRKNKTKNIEK